MTFPGEFLLATAIQPLLSAAMSPLIRTIQQGVNAAIPNEIPFWQSLVQLRYKGQLTKEKYQELMLEVGFDREGSEALYLGSSQAFAVADVVNLKRRGMINEAQYQQMALEAGILPDRVELLEKALAYYPSVQDMITFAVREAYTPSIVEEFKLDEDAPEKFFEEAQKAGLDKEQAILYWRSHWQLPSVQMGYEMLHRGIITPAELDLLLRTQDVMPFWREKLIQISFAPFTRVDVRRMYKLGVLDPEQVYRSYLDIGYDEEHAEQLTQFTILDIMEEDKALTKAEILKLVGYKEITIDKGAELLRELGYGEEEANYLLSLEIAKVETKDTTDQIKIWLAEYNDFLIDDLTLADNLRQKGLSATAIDRTVGEARVKRRKSLKHLEKADVLKLFVKGFFPAEEAIARLMLLGYMEDDAALLVQANTPEAEEVE